MAKSKRGLSPKRRLANTSSKHILDVPQEEPNVDGPNITKQIVKENKLVPSSDQNTSTTIGNIGETILQVLTSFDNVEKSNNKGEENIKGLDMPLQQKIHGIASLPHSNMGGENESTKIPSYLHPSPLHPNVVLQELHNLRNIQGA
jgi:hypothetical protein